MVGGRVISPEGIARRLADVRERIEEAGGIDVAVLAVTKGFGPEVLTAAVAAGCDRIGENYAQELLAKREAVAGLDGVSVHFIGRLQSNKVRQLAGVVDVFESVDRASLIDSLARRAPGVRILVQVNPGMRPGDGATKGGCAPGEVPELVERAREAGLVVDGLMTVGPTDGDPVVTRAVFREVRGLVDTLGLPVCSMGMSGDLEIAVEEGTTQVRIGTALFGVRPASER